MEGASMTKLDVIMATNSSDPSEYRRRNRIRAAIILPIFLFLAGCESFAKGVTSAILESRADEDDARLCSADGLPFPGIEPYLKRLDALAPIDPANPDRPQVKILYVHGIGTHLPGHGSGLMQNLAHSLGLSIRSPRPKRIVLQSSLMPDTELGELNLIRFTDEARKRDLVFYELTWSAINAPAKEAVAFDNTEVYRSRRASINHSLRAFINDVAPDPIAFAGNTGAEILTSIGQSMCWMWSSTWSDLPLETTGKSCDLGPKFGSRTGIDDVALITHSLGSRATMDALQSIVRRTDDVDVIADPGILRLIDALKEIELQLFMLSNQLPLLEAGQDPQEVTGAAEDYCEADSELADQRFLKSLNMVAFSDPNDVMSYPVPEEWVEHYVDSRLCPKVTNVTINIAAVRSLFGLAEFADPLTAHSGYGKDARVGGLLAKGAGHEDTAEIVQERCTWFATDESLMD
jgi:hypothetical protein